MARFVRSADPATFDSPPKPAKRANAVGGKGRGLPDRFDASMEALERGDVELAAELELSQRKRREDWKGRRVVRTFRIPVELDELLQDRAGQDDAHINEIGVLALWAYLS
jgi:hypothetical protein